MIPNKPVPDLIGDGNQFSEKHALGLDPRDHAHAKMLGTYRDLIERDRA